MNTLWASGFTLINIVAFSACAWDKQKAKSGGQRVPERVLWLFAFCFGALGTYLGMRIFRHKTQHVFFMLGVPMLLAAQIFAMIYLGVFAG